MGSRSAEDLWNTEQNVLTHLILGRGLCSLPTDHRLWAFLGLDPSQRSLENDERCYHGRDANCFAKGKKKSACRWWHFMPEEDEEELRKKYQEIVENWPKKKEQ